MLSRVIWVLIVLSLSLAALLEGLGVSLAELLWIEKLVEVESLKDLAGLGLLSFLFLAVVSLFFSEMVIDSVEVCWLVIRLSLFLLWTNSIADVSRLYLRVGLLHEKLIHVEFVVAELKLAAEPGQLILSLPIKLTAFVL